MSEESCFRYKSVYSENDTIVLHDRETGTCPSPAPAMEWLPLTPISQLFPKLGLKIPLNREIVILNLSLEYMKECKKEHPFPQQYKKCSHTFKLLEFAVNYNDPKILQYLTSKKIDLDTVFFKGSGLMDVSLLRCNKECVLFLFEEGLAISHEHLCMAYLNEWEDIQQLFIERMKAMDVTIEYDIIMFKILISASQNRYKICKSIIELDDCIVKTPDALKLLGNLIEIAKDEEKVLADNLDDIIFYIQFIEPKVMIDSLKYITIDDLAEFKFYQTIEFLIFYGLFDSRMNDLLENGETLLFRWARRGLFLHVRLLLEYTTTAGYHPINIHRQFTYGGKSNTCIGHLQRHNNKSRDLSPDVQSCLTLLLNYIGK